MHKIGENRFPAEKEKIKSPQNTQHSTSYCECECERERDRTLSIKTRLNLQKNKKKMVKKMKLKTLQSSFVHNCMQSSNVPLPPPPPSTYYMFAQKRLRKNTTI